MATFSKCYNLFKKYIFVSWECIINRISQLLLLFNASCYYYSKKKFKSNRMTDFFFFFFTFTLHMWWNLLRLCVWDSFDFFHYVPNTYILSITFHWSDASDIFDRSEVKYMYLPRHNVYLWRGAICSCVQMAVQTWRLFWCFCARWHGRPSPWEVRGLLPSCDLWPEWALLHWYRLSALREGGERGIALICKAQL